MAGQRVRQEPSGTLPIPAAAGTSMPPWRGMPGNVLDDQVKLCEGLIQFKAT